MVDLGKDGECLLQSSAVMVHCVISYTVHRLEQLGEMCKKSVQLILFYSVSFMQAAKRIIMFESVLPENSPHRQGKVYLIIFTLICSN